jgi:hypothetical protein
MTINPHKTDQMLAAFDGLNPHADCGGECSTEKAAQIIADRLTATLPGADPKLVGEVAMHIGDEINNVILSCRQAGNTWEQAAATAVVVALEAGVRLYRSESAEATP